MDLGVVLFSLWIGMFVINVDGVPEEPINGKWSSWITVGKCSKSSGIGELIQYRVCNNPPPNLYGKKCDGQYFRKIPCIVQPCPVDGVWSSWASVGSCSHSCGSGKEFQRRVCNNPAPRNGGKQCIGEPVQQIACNIKPCPVHGAWSSWESVGSCSKTCGSGEITQHRVCNHPAPINGGKQCIGKPVQQIACYIKPCPSVDGAWSSWESVGKCSKSCGSGEITQHRRCNHPAPKNGGKQCIGKPVQQIACYIKPCPVDGAWSEWTDYGNCSKLCGSEEVVKVRTCSNPAPANGGNDCEGDNVQRTACNIKPCLVPQKDCTDHYNNGERSNGLYIILPDGKTRTLVYCDMTDDGGWTVIHKRFDGSTRFWNRGWVEYKTGFGDKEKEYWVGLDTIHQLTRTNKRLKIEMTKYDNTHIYRAEYSHFEVGDEGSKYKLTVGGFKGNVRDSLKYHNNMAFSTVDTDNDSHPSGNCASSYYGAWWWKYCGHSNLNGKYSTSRGSSSNAMTWYDGSKWMQLQSATMKVRR